MKIALILFAMAAMFTACISSNETLNDGVIDSTTVDSAVVVTDTTAKDSVMVTTIAPETKK